MSRYDREAAFFDGLHTFDERHPRLSFATGWLIAVAAFTIIPVGPLVGVFGYDWLFGLDRGDTAGFGLAALGGSVLLASAVYAVMGLRQLVRPS